MSGLDIEGVLRDALDVEWHNGNITEEAAERLPAHVAAVLREQIDGALAEAGAVALQDAANALEGGLGVFGIPQTLYDVRVWLRARAAHLSDTERAGDAG